MECPQCGFVNPVSVSKCDCGYDFAAGRVDETHPTQITPPHSENYVWRTHPFNWLAECLAVMTAAGFLVDFLLAPYSHGSSSSGDGLIHPYITILLSALGAVSGVPLGLLLMIFASTRTFGGFLFAVGLGLGLGLWFTLPT